MLARTDFNAGNTTQSIPNMYHHVYEHNPQFPLGRQVQSHVPEEYVPR